MKKNILIIILIVIVLGLGVLIGYDKFIKKTSCPVCNKCDVKNNKTINFDAAKCINEDFEVLLEDSVLSKSSIFGDLILRIDITDEKVVKIYNQATTTNLTITFDKKVDSIYNGSLSNNMGGVYFFIMEDGTLEYMRYSDIYLSDKYEHKVIEGVSDIVKLETIFITDKNGPGSSVTTIAYKMDGTFYDLRKFDILKGDGVSR